MTDYSSPQSRSSSRPRSTARGRGFRQASGSASRVAQRAGSQAQARRAPAPVTRAGRARQLVLAVAVPNLVVVLIIVALALAALLLSSRPLAWLPTAIAQSWMICNLAPAAAAGVTVGFVPALPALGLGALVAYRVRQTIKHKVSVNDLLVLLAAAVAVPLILTGIAWLMLWDAGKVYNVAAPSLLTAVPKVIALHLWALAAGMGARLWRALASRYKAPPMLVDAALVALRYLLYAAGLSAAVAAACFLVRWQHQGELLASYPHLGAAGLLSLIAISVLYLPNAVVGTAAVLAGSQFHIGAGSVSLFSVHMVPLPPIPIAAAIPADAPSWAPVLLLAFPAAAVGALYKRRPSVAFACAAAVWAAAMTLVLCLLTTGELGYYGSVGPAAVTSAALIAVWLGAVGAALALAAALRTWLARRGAAGASAPASKPESDPEPAAEADAEEPEAADAKAVESDEGEEPGGAAEPEDPAEEKPAASDAVPEEAEAQPAPIEGEGESAEPEKAPFVAENGAPGEEPAEKEFPDSEAKD